MKTHIAHCKEEIGHALAAGNLCVSLSKILVACLHLLVNALAAKANDLAESSLAMNALA
jgi:hypothetical protein